jgi:Tol biopolymer transport system component
MSRLSRITALAALSLSAVVAAAQRPASFTPISLLPADASVDEYAVTDDGNRVYYSTVKGEIMLYDRKLAKTTRISEGGELWDVTVARNGSMVAFTKNGERRDEYIWTIPIDPTTGLAMGPQRRASMIPGDSPSLSQDGRMLAFARDDSAGQSLVVLPALGGPERILASFRAGIGRIYWTPDARTLYFSVGAPRDDQASGGTLQRISVNGGAPRVVTPASGAVPGLMHDGSALVLTDTGWHVQFVSDTNGRRLGTIMPPPLFLSRGWLGASTILLSRATNVFRPHIYDLVSGKDRILVDTMERTAWASWSPDGKRVAFGTRWGTITRLVLMNAGGSSGKAIPLRQSWGPGRWSPDGQRILYLSGQGPRAQIVVVVDAATGKQTEVIKSDQETHATWAADSRHIFYLGQAPGGPTGRTLSLREVDLSGASRVLLEIPGGPGHNIFPIDEKSALVRRGADQPTMLESLSGNRRAVQVLPPLPGFFGWPALSANAEWVAIRRNVQSEDNTKFSVIDIAKMDGSSHSTITPPFIVSAGGIGFLPGEKQLIFGGNSATERRQGYVYAATIATGALKQLFPLALSGNAPYAEFMISPDGKSVVYDTRDSLPAAYATLDVSSLLKSNP